MTVATNSRQGLSESQRREYDEQGFVVLRGFFPAEAIASLREETDRLLEECGDLIDPCNLRCRYMPHFETGEPLFEVFDPVIDISQVCRQFARDPWLLAVIESIYGEPACLFKDKLIFKPCGARGYDLHQDIPQYWPGFPRSFLTVLIAIDPTSRANGCTEVYAGYHRDFLMNDPATYMLPLELVDEERRTYLELEPGDIAIFHGLTPHRSEPNRSAQMRRNFFVSYNACSDGGDQRDEHYRQFRERMSQHRSAENPPPRLYFR